MPPDVWALLAEPFPRSSCTWRVVDVADDLQTARLARTLTRASIAARLDEAVGSSDWSFQLLPLGDRSLVCNLTVCGVSRAATATVAGGLTHFEPALLAEHALAAAAEQFGMSPAGKAIAWVDFDAESGEPLYLPDDEVAQLADDAGGLPSDQPSTLASTAEAGAERRDLPATGTLTGESGPDAKPAGHEVIERLLDRLREEGLGKEAARLVVTHGGYGRSQAESRELYGKLRALLLSVA
jgi:hypothetical protein